MTDEELLMYLTDRPCSVCTFHKENGCSKWNCVFEEKPEEVSEREKGEFDGMTNGEVFQATFPCEEIHINGLQEGIVHFSMKSNLDSMDCFSLEWWNAPYKAESEEDFPQAKDIEPTVKGFADTMDILDRIIGKAESEGDQ